MRRLLVALFIALAAPALAAVPSTISRVDATANGSTHTFTFTFPVTTSSSHVEVFLGGVKQTSGYVVTLNVNQTATPGGTVRFIDDFGVNKPPAASTAVRIQRIVPLTQETVCPSTNCSGKTTEKGLDRLAYQAQQVDRRVADAEATHAADKVAQDARDDAQELALGVGQLGGSQTYVTATGGATKTLAEWMALGPVAASDATVTVTGGTTPRALKDRVDVDVKEFGAVGDGVANDTAALQAAVNAGASLKRRVVVPPGTYMVNADATAEHTDSGGVKLPSNTHLVLQAGAVLKMIPSYAYASHILRVYGGSNVTVEGPGALQGDRAAHDYANPLTPGNRTTHEWNYAIYVRDATDVTIRGVTITESTGDSITVHKSSRVRVRDCRLDGARRNNVSVINETTDVLIEGNTISRAGYNDGVHDGTAPRFGIDIEGGDISSGTSPQRVKVKGNTFTGNVGASAAAYNGVGVAMTGNTADAPLAYSYGIDVAIVGNVLREPAGATGTKSAIYGLAVAGSMDTNGATIVGNVISGFSPAIDARGANILVADNDIYKPRGTGVLAYAVTRCRIDGNLIVQPGVNGITVSPTASDCTITDNDVDAAAAAGIETAGATHVIRDNRIRGTPQGVLVTGGTALIEGNDILPEGVASQTYQIQVNGSSTVAVVRGNLVRGTTSTALLGASNPTLKIVGNRFVETTGSGGINVTSTNRVEVIDNLVTFARSSPGGTGIVLVNTTGAPVIKNTVYPETANALTYAIKTDGAASSAVIANITSTGTVTTAGGDTVTGNLTF